MSEVLTVYEDEETDFEYPENYWAVISELQQVYEELDRWREWAARRFDLPLAWVEDPEDVDRHVR